MPFTDYDRDVLRSMGVFAEPSFDEERMKLAKHIAKHEPPTLRSAFTLEELGPMILDAINAMSESEKAKVRDYLRRDLLDTDDDED